MSHEITTTEIFAKLYDQAETGADLRYILESSTTELLRKLFTMLKEYDKVFGLTLRQEHVLMRIEAELKFR